MLYRLIFMNGPRKGEQATLPIDMLIIGRGEGCGLRLEDPEAAIQHACIELTDMGPRIRDLGSMNRILVNRRETREAVLKHGDVLEIGHTQFLLQAFVQAEIMVSSPSSSPSRERTRIVLRGLTIVALVAGTGILLARFLNPRPPAGPAPGIPPPVSAPAPDTSPVAPSSASSSAMAGEIQRMREELATIKQAVESLSPQTPAGHDTESAAPSSDMEKMPKPEEGSPASPPPPGDAAPAGPAPEPPAIPPEVEAAQRAADEERRARDHEIELVRKESAAGFNRDAEERLSRLLAQYPEYLPALTERAVLLEKQGNLEAAAREWVLVLQRSSAAPQEAARAADEWERLSVELRQRKQTASTAPTRGVRIGSLSQRRFLDSPQDYDEMRAIRILLVGAAEDLPVPSDIRVEVTFFDRNPQTGAIGLTRAQSATIQVVPHDPWSGDRGLLLTAAYVVPCGMRMKSGGDEFYGYVVRVFAKGELQDEDARPMDLLAQPSPPPPAIEKSASSPAGPSMETVPAPALSEVEKEEGVPVSAAAPVPAPEPPPEPPKP